MGEQQLPAKAPNRPMVQRTEPRHAKGNGWAPTDPQEAANAPPNSLEAEQGVLGGLLLDNGAWPLAAELLNAQDFYRHEHRLIFTAITQLIAAGQPADVLTVAEQLQTQGKAEDAGGRSYLNALAASVPSAANVRRYAEIVRECAVLRGLIALSDEIAASAFNPKGRTAGQIFDAASAAFNRIGERCESSRPLLLSLASLREASQALQWLVKHLIPLEIIAMLFGAPGTFKSFIALDCALHVAHGLPWLGRRTRQGAVIYIAAEGGAGVWKRIEAWHRLRGLNWQDVPLYVVPMAINLGTEARRVVNAAQATGVTPALVVVDTLSQTYSGEENSANEMAAYLRELGVCFREVWRCAVLLIHHSGHNATERPRGSSAIPANVDVLMGVHRDEKEMLATLSNPKQKDGDEQPDSTFALKAVEIGKDADGDPITSLVAWHLSSNDEIASAVLAEQQAGRGGRDHLFLALVQNGMREKELRQLFYDGINESKPDTRKHAYQRARDKAVKAGLIEIAQGHVIDLRRPA